MARFGRFRGLFVGYRANYALEQEKRGFKRFTASRGAIVADFGRGVADFGGFYDQQQLFLVK